jgi:hypothetical protein
VRRAAETEAGAAAARWAELPADVRAQLAGRLAGLYGHATDEAAYDSLGDDKRETLLIFLRRFSRFGLWHAVERVTNVYGEGGVGIEFAAREDLSDSLGSHPRFTPRFAGHGGATAGGFYELRRARAALHFLRMRADPNRWAVHFDEHGPLAGPLSFLRHLWHEAFRKRTPGWRAIKFALGYAARAVEREVGSGRRGP